MKRRPLCEHVGSDDTVSKAPSLHLVPFLPLLFLRMDTDVWLEKLRSDKYIRATLKLWPTTHDGPQVQTTFNGNTILPITNDALA